MSATMIVPAGRLQPGMTVVKGLGADGASKRITRFSWADQAGRMLRIHWATSFGEIGSSVINAARRNAIRCEVAL